MVNPIEIPKWAQKALSPDDVRQINEAIVRAEQGTRGEVVPVLMYRSTPPPQNWLIPRFHWLQRFMIPDSVEVTQCLLQAQAEFYRQDLARSPERGAVVLLLSWVERRAVVLADKNAASVISDDHWMEVTQMITQGAKAGQLARGMIQAIEHCGKLLRDKMPAAPSDASRQVLSNHLVIRD